MSSNAPAHLAAQVKRAPVWVNREVGIAVVAVAVRTARLAGLLLGIDESTQLRYCVVQSCLTAAIEAQGG